MTVLTAGIAVAYCPSTRAQVAAPTTAPSDAPVDPQSLVNRDLVELSTRLMRPAPPVGAPDQALAQQQREEAAGRLTSRRTSQTNAILLGALQSPTAPREAKLAIARAVADEALPDPALTDALLSLLGGERILSDAAAHALARYSENAVVRDRMIAFSQSANQPANLRLGVVRALGSFVSRPAADVLIALAADARQGPAIQSAAMDALAELTGLSGNGHDIDRWRQWQAAAPRTDPAWREQVFGSRSARLTGDNRANSDEINELAAILDEQYQQGDFNTKKAIITRELDSYDAHVRARGVQRVNEELRNAAPIPASAPRRLREMIGDSDAGVRILVAQAIRSRIDPEALDPLLAQLRQETNIDAKIAEIDTVAALRRVRSIVELRRLLRDPSLAAAEASVRAIEAISGVLVAQNPQVAHAVGQELFQVSGQRAGEPGGAAFRAAAIEAAGMLHDRDLSRELLDLLSPNEDPAIRIAALRALGSIGDRATSFPIAEWLGNEPSAPARASAIAALGSTSTFEFAADTLYRYMSPNTEPDPAVREQAWRQFQSLLPTATNVVVLNRWADEFKKDPTRRLQVLLALNDKLQRDLQDEALAYSRQNTGATYMDPKIAEPSKAAIQFEQALAYWQEKPTRSTVTAQLVEQLLGALLAARDYDRAATFSARQIARDATQQTTIGRDLKDAANRLHDEGIRDNDGAKLRDGTRLCEAILKMQPPLAARFQDEVKTFDQEMQDKLKTLPK